MPTYNVGGRQYSAPSLDIAVKEHQRRAGTPLSYAAWLDAGGRGTGDAEEQRRQYQLYLDNGDFSSPVAPQPTPGAAPGQQTPNAGADHNQIIQDLIAGRISEQQARARLAAIGVPQNVIDTEVRAVVGTTGAGGGGAFAGTPITGSGVPTAKPGLISPDGSPVNNEFLGGQQGQADVLRRYSLESGIAPNFQPFLQNLAQQQILPFALSRARAGLDVGVATPNEALSFLRGQGIGNVGLGAGSMASNSLRDAANFLRSPQHGSIYGPQQQYISDELLGESGSVGSELFAPIIKQLQEAGSRRVLPGMGQATGTFLQNYLAMNPTQFQTAPAFLDWLQTQGLI